MGLRGGSGLGVREGMCGWRVMLCGRVVGRLGRGVVRGVGQMGGKGEGSEVGSDLRMVVLDLASTGCCWRRRSGMLIP